MSTEWIEVMRSQLGAGEQALRFLYHQRNAKTKFSSYQVAIQKVCGDLVVANNAGRTALLTLAPNIVELVGLRATEIADGVCDGPPDRCFGWKAKVWQAAWDGACTALGGVPADYRR